jgi:hypothetical protein
MIGAVEIAQEVFRLGIKLFKRGIHRRMASKAFELLDLRLERIAPGFRMIHGIDFSHRSISFLGCLGIPFSGAADQLGIPLEGSLSVIQ